MLNQILEDDFSWFPFGISGNFDTIASAFLTYNRVGEINVY